MDQCLFAFDILKASYFHKNKHVSIQAAEQRRAKYCAAISPWPLEAGSKIESIPIDLHVKTPSFHKHVYSLV